MTEYTGRGTTTSAKTGSLDPIRLIIHPPLLVSWLNKRQRNSNIILIDFEADSVSDSTLRLDINVVFNPISVRQGLITRADFYIGSTGAEISIDMPGATIKNCTQSKSIEVNYSNTENFIRKSALTLTPKQDGVEPPDTPIGSIHCEMSDERVFSASFASEERYLATTLLNDAVKWTITLPRGTKVIRDFLLGNLYLNATCFWPSHPRNGVITIRPSDVRFYDANRRPLSAIKSLLMEAILWKADIKLQNRDGFNIEFQEGSF